VSAAGILGLGLWLPEQVRGNDAWPESFTRGFHAARAAGGASDFTAIEARAEGRPYDELYRRHALPHDGDPFKGAVERRVAPSDQPSVIGDTQAALRALEDARVDPEEVDLVLSSALVPDKLVPSNGPAIQHLAGCVHAAAIGVESYCSAGLAQLDLAAGLVEAGRARHVLCVQSHQIARINDLEVPISPLFGDASSAFVVGPVPDDRGLVRMVRGGDGSLHAAVTHAYRDTPGARWWLDAAGPVRPGSDDFEGARRFTHNLLAYAIDTVRELCALSAFPVEEAAALVMMQPIAWFQPAVADGLGLPEARVPTTFTRYGHLGAAGIVANLVEARRGGLLRDGAPVLAYAHGAGMTRYAALLRWHVRA
jgi:3-oxoacyl-[acyl-carrier-protein] synthase-3